MCKVNKYLIWWQSFLVKCDYASYNLHTHTQVIRKYDITLALFVTFGCFVFDREIGF